MEKVGWTNRVKNEVLPSVRKERNILHARKWRLTGLLTSFRRNFLLKQFAEGKSIAGGRGRRRKLLLHDLKEKRKYWELEALDNFVCKIGFGRGYRRVARQTRQ
jgi:hypothetical protein